MLEKNNENSSRQKTTSGLKVPTGSGEVIHAISRVELYPQKFHANRFTRLGGDRFTHIKKTASKHTKVRTGVIIGGMSTDKQGIFVSF